MRDNLKNKQYYMKLIENTQRDILIYGELVEEALREKNESDRGVRNGYNILINLYQKQINLLYSFGEELDKIKKQYEKLLHLYCKMWDRKYGYIELIKVLSLAVLFEIDKDLILELEQKLTNEKMDDFLVNKYMKEIDEFWYGSGDKFEFSGIYDCLKLLFEEKKYVASDKLKDYLQNKWYDIHRECSWYNSHLSKKDIYYGYWSFEAGAIAKILNLDDSSLKDVPYYPYDLVHYKNEK